MGGGVEEGAPGSQTAEGFRKARFSVLEGETSILDAMGGRCGGRGRQAHQRVGIYSLLGGVKNVVFWRFVF